MRNNCLILLLLLILPASGFASEKPHCSYIPDSVAQIYSQALGIELDSCINVNFFSYLTTWIGTPYSYGRASRKGTDCSGFVTSVFRDVFCINLTRSSSDMFRQDVEPVKRAELQTGDLLFFKTRKGRISHVGIYLKDGKFIHSATCCGVSINSLDEEFYRITFHGVGRVKAVMDM